MRWVFAISLILGILALIAWAMLRGRRGDHSDSRRSTTVRRAIAAGVAFGMGGLSASYAGWDLWLATLAAVIAGVLAAWYSGTSGTAGGEGRF